MAYKVLIVEDQDIPRELFKIHLQRVGGYFRLPK